MSGKLQPALLGGVLIGVLSALPYVSKLNACCCLWIIAGGVLTTYLLREQTPSNQLTAMDAAITGLLAGAFGAVVAAVLGQIIGMMTGADPKAEIDQLLESGQFPPEVVRIFERFRELPNAVWFVLGMAVQLVIFPIFAMLGSLLGVAIFKKTPPPPPPGTVDILPPEQPPM